jgi:hypothetical protein
MSETTEKKRPRGKSQQERRELMRNELWPDSEKLIWRSKGNSGFVPLPRVLPLIGELIRTAGGKGDPSRVYMDLWFRCFDDGYVQIDSVELLAFSAGYQGTRATRTWKEHMLRLAELEFIMYRGNPANEFRYVLLIDPVVAAQSLRRRQPQLVSDEWWNNFAERLLAIGGTLPQVSQTKEKKVRKRKSG